MDHLYRSLLNAYTAQPLDRSAHGRKNPDWLAAQLANTQSEYLMVDEHAIVTVNRVPLILTRDQFLALNASVTPLLLGIKKTDKTPVFLVNIPEVGIFDSIESITLDCIDSLSLKEITADISSEMASIYSYAMLLNHWHMTTRFCTRCGSGLEIKEGGSLQQCTNEACGHIEYPRINPAVIMRVTKGGKILLARQANWPERIYSVLAGFVEVGETLEHAVEREVMEEVNIQVKNIHYHSSQPHPFPNSMMLGYTAEATSYEFELEQDDIEHALWLRASEMKKKMIEGSVQLPSSFSISYNLINDWFHMETGVSLSELPIHSS